LQGYLKSQQKANALAFDNKNTCLMRFKDMKPLTLLVLFFFCYLQVSAQADSTTATTATADSLIVADSTITEAAKTRDGWLLSDYPNPKKALIIGLALPGGGQIYNKRWWKLPLVYGALFGMGYTIDYNQSRYRRLRTALDLKRNDQAHEFSNTTLDSEQALKSLRDQFDKNTQLSYVGIFLVYTLQALEAFVDAHLKGFDVDDDIGMQLKPEAGYIPAIGTATIGIGVSIPLHRKPLLGVENAPIQLGR
jgi:hypothetical protein